MKLKLTASVTTAPDFDGWGFFVAAGKRFDVDAYAEAYGVNRADLDINCFIAVVEKARALKVGEWLKVSHEMQSTATTEYHVVCVETGMRVTHYPFKTKSAAQARADKLARNWSGRYTYQIQPVERFAAK